MSSTRDPAAVRADFDRIARLSPSSSAPDAMTRWLLGHLPDRCSEILEIGCGTGEATRIAAERVARVVALDLSPQMVAVARERSAGLANIDYHVADVTRWDYREARFDAVVSIATLHHLPFDDSIAAWKRTLRPGGVMLILDLVDRSHPRYLPLNALALLSQALDRDGSQPSALRRAYRDHGAHDEYLRPREACALFAEHLPGARVTHHLRWRYSVVWRKPGE